MTTTETESAKTPARQSLFSARMAFCMGAIVVLQAAVLMFVLARPKLPFPGASSIEQFPAAICVLSLVCSFCCAPLVLARETPPALVLARALFAAAWQGTVLGFFLLVSARLTPLESSGIALACLWQVLFSLAAILLSRNAGRAYFGIIFFWVFALPVSAYLLAEIFLISPGGNMGWTQATGAKANAMRATVHWLLSLSPSTASSGALSGVLADGSDSSSTLPLTLLATLNVVLAALLWRRKSRIIPIASDE